MKTEKIYADSEEKWVKATKIYADDTDGNLLYYDEDFTEGNEVSRESLENLFVKGVVIDYDGALYRPISISVSSGTATVTIITVETVSTVETATPVACVSATDEA